MFETILQGINESAAPQPMPFAPPQMPLTQSAATPLGGIIAVLQNKADRAAPVPNASPIVDARFGPLIVPANTLGEDASGTASQPQQAPIPFLFRPTVAPATRMADQTADIPTDLAPSPVADPLAAPAQEQAAPQQNTEQLTTPVNVTPPPFVPQDEIVEPPVQQEVELPADPVAPQPAMNTVAQPADTAVPAPQPSTVAQQDPAAIAVPVNPTQVEAAPKPATGKVAQQDAPLDDVPLPPPSKVGQQDPTGIAIPANPAPIEPAKGKTAQNDTLPDDVASPQPSKVALEVGIAVPASPAPTGAAPKPAKGKSAPQEPQDIALPADASPVSGPVPQPVADPAVAPQPPFAPQPVVQQSVVPQTVVQQMPVAAPTMSPAAEPTANDGMADQLATKPKMPSASLQTAEKNNAPQAPQTPLPQATPVATTDADTLPPSDNAADTTQPIQVASADPAVFVAPMAAPEQAAPVQAAPVQAAPAAKPAADSISTVNTEAPKNARPAVDTDTTDQNAAPFKAHVQSAPHPAAPKPDVSAAPAPANEPAATPVADAPNNSGVVQNAAATQNTGAPQADNTVPSTPQHAQPPTPPVAPANPALAAPSGLRKLTAGLQLSAQEQETTSTLDKIGVSIVTRATEGLRHFDIRLDPPELGRVDVRLTVDDSGKAHASLLVDRPQTLEMLQRDSSSLNRALSDAGLDMSNNGLNFSLRDPNRQNDGGVDQGRGRALSAKAVVQTDAIPIHSSLGSYAPNSVRLDIRV